VWAALLVGRLLTADGEPVAGVRVIVVWSRDTTAFDAADTLPVDAAGRFAALVRPTADDSIRIVVSASGESPYHGAALALPRARADEEIRIVLVPRRWTIERGPFQGETIAIDPAAALHRSPDRSGPSFARVTRRRTVGWAPESYPIPIAFRHAAGAYVGARDSVEFWAAARAVESAIGASLFRPTDDTTIAGRVYPVTVGVGRIGAAGVTYVSWDRDGNIFEGSITFRSTRELRAPSIVEHELLHLLGFGHTAAWPSALEAQAPAARTITADDVAYAQLLLRVHALEADSLVVGGLATAR
jgi:hypothetical protein